jgi:hypothetical protein
MRVQDLAAEPARARRSHAGSPRARPTSSRIWGAIWIIADGVRTLRRAVRGPQELLASETLTQPSRPLRSAAAFCAV